MPFDIAILVFRQVISIGLTARVPQRVAIGVVTAAAGKAHDIAEIADRDDLTAAFLQNARQAQPPRGYLLKPSHLIPFVEQIGTCLYLRFACAKAGSGDTGHRGAARTIGGSGDIHLVAPIYHFGVTMGARSDSIRGAVVSKLCFVHA